VAGELLRQVAIELEEEAEEAVAHFALCKRTRGRRLIVEPSLVDYCQPCTQILWQQPTYRFASNMRNGVACRLLGCITQQDISLGVVLAVRGIAVVRRHPGGFVLWVVLRLGVLVEGHIRLQIFVTVTRAGLQFIALASQWFPARSCFNQKHPVGKTYEEISQGRIQCVVLVWIFEALTDLAAGQQFADFIPAERFTITIVM
jgi:hypothetical protein